MKNVVRSIASCAFAAALAGIAAACGAKLAPPVVTAPHFPEFIVPTLSPPDPRLAPLQAAHDAAWQFLQAGDLNQAERNFQAVLKRFEHRRADGTTEAIAIDSEDWFKLANALRK